MKKVRFWVEIALLLAIAAVCIFCMVVGKMTCMWH